MILLNIPLDILKLKIVQYFLKPSCIHLTISFIKLIEINHQIYKFTCNFIQSNVYFIQHQMIKLMYFTSNFSHFKCPLCYVKYAVNIYCDLRGGYGRNRDYCLCYIFPPSICAIMRLVCVYKSVIAYYFFYLFLQLSDLKIFSINWRIHTNGVF